MSKIRVEELETLDGLNLAKVEDLAKVGDPETGLDRRVIYVDTVADLQALDTSGLVEGQQASVGEAGMFVWSGSEWLPKNSETITVRIPSDYPTLQEAIDTLSNFKTAQGVTIDLLIESGHQLQKGLLVKNGYYNHFEIKSEDPIVYLSTDFSGITGVTGVSSGDNSIFASVNAKFPVLSILIDAEDHDGAGMALFDCSSCVVSSGSGIKNVLRMGVTVSGSSSIKASGSVFSGAGAGNRVSTNSRGNFATADLSGARKIDTSASACMDVSRGSIVNLMGTEENPTNLSGGADRGLAVRRSLVSATNIDVSNSGADGVIAESASVVSCRRIIADNCRDGVSANSGSTISCGEGSAKNCSRYGLLASSGSKIDARNFDATGAGEAGANCVHGSHMNLRDSNLRKGEEDSDEDMQITAGSVISAFTTIGGTNRDVNTLSRNGVIYRNV